MAKRLQTYWPTLVVGLVGAYLNLLWQTWYNYIAAEICIGIGISPFLRGD